MFRRFRLGGPSRSLATSSDFECDFDSWSDTAALVASPLRRDLRASPLPPTPRVAVVVWIKRTKKEHTARSLKLKDEQGRVVNVLTKADTLTKFFTDKSSGLIQGGRGGGVHHRQPHRSEMIFEVEVHFYMLFTMVFGVEVHF